MNAEQILWAINSGLLIMLGFFVRHWISKTERKLDGKLDAILCLERHEDTKTKCASLYKHKHAPTSEDGRGGEVIIP